MRQWIIATFLAITASAAACGQTPVRPEHALIAWRDLSWNVPANLKPYTRYLVLRPDGADARVVTGHLHHLSRTVDIVVPPVIEGQLLRIYTIDYGWDPKVYERLADVDPYCHIDVEAGGKKSRAHAPLLSDSKDGPNAMAYLVEHTKSNVPILTAEWFFNQTAAQQDRAVGYYDLLGLKTLDDFDRLIGFDRKLAKAFGQTLREAISISSVTLQPRAIVRQATLGGAKWSSLDYKVAKGAKNPLRIIGEDTEKDIDATEIYGHLPNGFWCTFLADGKGVRQDAAPGFIAGDNRSKSNDKQVHINVGCTRCHTNGGLKDLDGWFRGHLAGPIHVGTFDYAKHLEFRREYLKAIEPFIKRDRDRFEASVREATGWGSRRYAEKYAEYWEEYEDAKVDLAWAARSVGAKDAAEFKAALDARLKSGLVDPKQGAIDLVLAGLLGGGTIGIRQWEEVYPLAVLVWRGRK